MTPRGIRWYCPASPWPLLLHLWIAVRIVAGGAIIAGRVGIGPDGKAKYAMRKDRVDDQIAARGKMRHATPLGKLRTAISSRLLPRGACLKALGCCPPEHACTL